MQPGQENTSSVICIECWESIKDFHTYQEWIIKTQLQFRNQSSTKDEQTQQGESTLIKETAVDSSQQVAMEEDSTSDVASNSATECKASRLTQNGQDLHLQSSSSPSNKNTINLELRNICRCKKSKALYAKSGPNSTKDHYKVICCPLKEKMLKNDTLVNKVKGSLECGECNAKFRYYSTLRLHFKYDHPNAKFYMMCCERKLQQLAITMEHIRLHLNPNMFRCKICFSCFTAKSALKTHLKDFHGIANLQLPCTKCNKTFLDNASLVKHNKVKHSKSV